MRETGAYHLVGGAGVGMSALAQALLACGAAVSASDRYLDSGHRLEVIDQLAAAGVAWCRQDGSGVRAGLRAVVVSSAIEDDNPDVSAARRLGIPVRLRGELLAALTAGADCIAIAGTSGKSTVTGMLGWMLEQTGRDPFVVNGAPVRNWMSPDRIGNVRPGSGGLWVVEADESDRSLLHLQPRHAVITNISGDHFSEAETLTLFKTFAGQVSGQVFGPPGKACIPDGFSPVVSAGASTFAYGDVAVRVPLPGRHNAENAFVALAVCEALGVPVRQAADALAGFRGIARRLEPVASGPPAVVDDYAHNPAKIMAAWRALAPYYEVLHAVWRPHGYGPLRAMFEPLVSAFAELARPGDRVLVLPVYDAGGSADRSMTSEAFVAALCAAGVGAECMPDYDAVCRYAGAHPPPDAWLTMGARDPDLPALARRLAALA